MSWISRHRVVSVTRALSFADHVTKRNGGLWGRELIFPGSLVSRPLVKRNEEPGYERVFKSIWLDENYRTSTLRMLKIWQWPEVLFLGADQKNRGLWGRECGCMWTSDMRSGSFRGKFTSGCRSSDHPTIIFYLQILPTGVCLDPIRNWLFLYGKCTILI